MPQLHFELLSVFGSSRSNKAWTWSEGRPCEGGGVDKMILGFIVSEGEFEH